MNNNYLKKELYDLVKTDEKIFDFIQESSLDGLWYWDLEHPEEEWMNPKFWSTLGYVPEEMPHKADAWKDIIHPDDLKTAIQNAQQHFIDPSHAYDQVVRYTHKKGNTIWIRCRGMAIRNAEGEPVRMLGAHVDITEEKKQAELLNITNQVARVGGWEVDLVNNKVTWTSVTKEIHEVAEDYEPELASGINFYQEGKHRNRIRELVNKSIIDGSAWDEEFILITAKGNERWVRAKGVTELTKNKVTRIYGTFQDIHSQKLRELQLAQSEQRFKQTFENAAIGMAIVGLDGSWIKVNKCLCKIIGYSEEELRKLTFQDITHPEDLDLDLKFLKDVLDNKIESYQLDKRYFHKNGSIVWIQLAVSIIKDEQGKPLHFVSQINDITEQKKAEHDFLDSHARLVSLLDATDQVSIIGTTTEGVITTFNKGAQNLLGYTEEEILNKQTPFIIHKKEEMKARAKEIIKEAGREIAPIEVFTYNVNQGKFEGGEWTYIRKDGSTFPVQLIITAQRNRTGEINGYLGVGIDISKIKEAEKKLVQLNKELAQKNDELEQFAYIAAHDLQEPLRTISSFISMLEKKYDHLLDEKGKQYIHFTVDGAQRMRQIITDILDYAKAGITNNTDIDLNRVVADIITSFENAKKTNQAVIKCAKLPVLLADKTAMHQLFSNLIGNGIKYQPAGNTPVIEINVEDNNDKWQFKVADNGIGIEPKFYEKVFAVFKRLHSKSEYQGTGIGLAICKKIVSNYNGDIWIEPTAGGGSTFCFTMEK